MALTTFQREVCRLLAANRIAGGESYVAGGAALNTLLEQPRLSADVDIFHDSLEAVARAWDTDRITLQAAGYGVDPLVERPAYVEAAVIREPERVAMQWTQDSAYRFFPLVEHPDLGLALHPFDLATNKVLALVGRLEVRDWIDTIACAQTLQPLGYLAWAASGKDPGLNPSRILAEAARSSHYARAEVEALAYAGPAPDAAELSRVWHVLLAEALEIVDLLPAEQVGACVMAPDGALLRDSPEALGDRLKRQEVRFHPAVLRGAYPSIVHRA